MPRTNLEWLFYYLKNDRFFRIKQHLMIMIRFHLSYLIRHYQEATGHISWLGSGLKSLVCCPYRQTAEGFPARTAALDNSLRLSHFHYIIVNFCSVSDEHELQPGTEKHRNTNSTCSIYLVTLIIG